LFRIFAGTPATPEGILKFANDYGRLGSEEMQVIGVPAESAQGSVAQPGVAMPVGEGEPFAAWVLEIMSMRQALALWDMHEVGDNATIRRHVRWVDSTRVVYARHPADTSEPASSSGVETIADSPEVLALFTPGDIMRPALWYLQKVVNAHLEGRVSPRLLWSRDEGRPQLFIRPHSLIGVLWLQFAQAIDGHKTYRECLHCGKWFELSPELGIRKHRVYCSNACRTRAYRDRVNHVQERMSEDQPAEVKGRYVKTTRSR
jgi:hypothetical protein